MRTTCRLWEEPPGETKVTALPPEGHFVKKPIIWCGAQARMGGEAETQASLGNGCD